MLVAAAGGVPLEVVVVVVACPVDPAVWSTGVVPVSIVMGVEEAVPLVVVEGVEVAVVSEVMSVVVVVVVVVAGMPVFGSYTTTERAAVPTTPSWSVAL